MSEAEWHDAKAQKNKKKHKGLSFEAAQEVFGDPYAVEIFDETHSTLDELRFKVLGRIKNQTVVVVVYTQRSDKIRIISARYASVKERQAYYDSF